MGNGRRDVVRYFFIKNFTCCDIFQKKFQNYITALTLNKIKHIVF